MKITTQRQILWIVNFSLVLGLLGFVFLMQRNGSKARNRRLIKYVERVEAALSKVKLKKVVGETTKKTKLRTFLSKDFHFEGYIPPVVRTPTDRGTRKPQAPALDSLIEVGMVLASWDSDEEVVSAKGANALERAGAFVTIKSLGSTAFSTYWYEVGETIGVGSAFRADNDPTLEKWGPCVLLEVTKDGIVCSWNKEKDKATVAMAIRSNPENAWVEGFGVKIGGPETINNRKVGVGVMTPAGVGLAIFKPGKTRRGGNIVELTKEGISLFDRGDGEKLLSEIGTKSTKGGLQVTSIPKRLREFGLQEGDVVIRVDNMPVKNKATVTNYVRKNYKRKKQFQVTVLRNGRQKMFGVRVPKKTSGLGNAGRGIKFGK